MTSYINSTDSNPWDQMIVLSQKTINESFQNMWEVAQLDGDSPLTHYERTTRGGEYLKFDVGAPSVELQVVPKDELLFFKLHMTSGSCFIYLSDDSNDDSHIDWQINDWGFAFSVSIAQKTVAKESQEYKDFKNRSGLLNWDFSLACLFIDTSSSTKFSEELSTFGDRQSDYNTIMTARSKGVFQSFVSEWVNVMAASGCNILGYSAQASADTSDQYQPTFPPTLMDYDTYPWKATPTSANQDNLDTNSLCYLMMSNFTVPATDAVTYSGQWTDDQHGGTYVLNRSLFWPWMFTVLRDVVKAMVPVPDVPTLYWDNTDPNHPYASRMEYHFGDNTASDDSYKFVSTGPGQWSWTGVPLSQSNKVANPNDGSDYETIVESTNVPKPGAHIFDSPCQRRHSQFTAGQEQISLTGKSTFVVRVDHSRKKNPTYTLMTFVLTWSVSIAVAAVEDGGVQFTIINSAVDTESTSEGNLSWVPSADVVASNLKTQMSNSLTNAASTANANLMNVLANQHRLYLPAKGHFLMHDPVFNSKGDLLVGLEYNGADAPPPPAKK